MLKIKLKGQLLPILIKVKIIKIIIGIVRNKITINQNQIRIIIHRIYKALFNNSTSKSKNHNLILTFFLNHLLNHSLIPISCYRNIRVISNFQIIYLIRICCKMAKKILLLQYKVFL